MPDDLSPSPFNRVFNVFSYGAKADGVTDDAPAIQRAVDALQANNGGTLFMPPGTYACNSVVKIVGPGNMHLVGYGATMKRNANYGAMWHNFNPSTGPDPTNYPVYSGPSNIKFEGLTLDCNGDSIATNVVGIMFAHCENITFENIKILDVVNNHALDISSTRNLTVTGCTFKGFDPVTAGQESAEAIQIDGSHSAVSAASAPYDDTTCDGVYITNNFCSASSSLGGWGSFVGSHGNPPDGVFQSNLVVSGNTVKDIMHYPVKAFQWRHSTITGNTFVNCNGGVRVHIDENATSLGSQESLAQSVIISNNVFENSGVINGHPSGVQPAVVYVSGNGSISVPLRDLMVTNNIFRSFANVDGIKIEYVDEAIITGNSFRNKTSAAGTGDCISINDSVGVLCVENTMKSHNGDMITWDRATGTEADRVHLPSLLLYRTTTQSIPNATRTAISWSSVAMNTGPGDWWDIATPTVIKLPWAGLYQMSVFVGWASDTTGSRTVHLNRTTTISTTNHIAGDVSGTGTAEHIGNRHLATTFLEATAGTEYVVSVRQDSGGSLDITEWMTGQPAHAWVSFTYLGNATS